MSPSVSLVIIHSITFVQQSHLTAMTTTKRKTTPWMRMASSATMDQKCEGVMAANTQEHGSEKGPQAWVPSADTQNTVTPKQHCHTPQHCHPPAVSPPAMSSLPSSVTHIPVPPSRVPRRCRPGCGGRGWGAPCRGAPGQPCRTLLIHLLPGRPLSERSFWDTCSVAFPAIPSLSCGFGALPDAPSVFPSPPGLRVWPGCARSRSPGTGITDEMGSAKPHTTPCKLFVIR